MTVVSNQPAHTGQHELGKRRMYVEKVGTLEIKACKLAKVDLVKPDIDTMVSERFFTCPTTQAHTHLHDFCWVPYLVKGSDNAQHSDRRQCHSMLLIPLSESCCAQRMQLLFGHQSVQHTFDRLEAC